MTIQSFRLLNTQMSGVLSTIPNWINSHDELVYD
jgi:hypothetical protein